MKKTSFLLLLLLTSTTIVLAISPPIQAESVDLWAVVVGVDGGDATHLDNDAMDFAEALTTVYGYPSENVKLLTNEGATKADVLSALDWLDSQESNSSGVSIFFATHGSPDQLHLAGDTYLSDSELAGAISQLESPSVFVAVCACYSGSFVDVADSFSTGVLVTACNATELTYDTFGGNTVFPYFFVEEGMLQGLADVDGDGRVTVEEAFRYARGKCEDPPIGVPSTHPQMVDKYSDEELYLASPIHAPWFTSLPLILLATVTLLTYLRKKQKTT